MQDNIYDNEMKMIGKKQWNLQA